MQKIGDHLLEIGVVYWTSRLQQRRGISGEVAKSRLHSRERQTEMRDSYLEMGKKYA